MIVTPYRIGGILLMDWFSFVNAIFWLVDTIILVFRCTAGVMWHVNGAVSGGAISCWWIRSIAVCTGWTRRPWISILELWWHVSLLIVAQCGLTLCTLVRWTLLWMAFEIAIGGASAAHIIVSIFYLVFTAWLVSFDMFFLLFLARRGLTIDILLKSFSSKEQSISQLSDSIIFLLKINRSKGHNWVSITH